MRKYISILGLGISSINLNSADCVNKVNHPKAKTLLTANKDSINKPILSWHFVLCTPANILPFTGLFVGSFYQNKFNFGFGAGLSGPYMVPGLHYFQTHLYGNTNLPENWYIGTKIGYRAMISFATITSRDFPPESPKYFEGKMVSTNAGYISMPIYAGVHVDEKQSYEFGIDFQIRLYKYNKFDYDNLTPEARESPENIQRISNELTSSEKYFNMFESVS